MTDLKRTTIVFPIKDNQVLLGMKKLGHGVGWWNGFGGKLEEGEGYQASAIRETEEESGLKINNLRAVAHILFYWQGDLRFANVVYITDDFNGEPVETNEMQPKWFAINSIPYEKMRPSDRLWIKEVMKHRPKDRILEYALYFDKDNNFIKSATPDKKVLEEFFSL